jgi:hypothetical protein
MNKPVLIRKKTLGPIAAFAWCAMLPASVLAQAVTTPRWLRLLPKKIRQEG